MTGPRVFSPDEVNGIIPELDRLFSELDGIRSAMRALKLHITALEMIWGEEVRQRGNPDHDELEHHLAEMRDLQTSFDRVTRKVQALGGQLKSVEPALVDFYGVRDGFLIVWCWSRGDDRVEHWHHVDEGFAGRQPIHSNVE